MHACFSLDHTFSPQTSTRPSGSLARVLLRRKLCVVPYMAVAWWFCMQRIKCNGRSFSYLNELIIDLVHYITVKLIILATKLQDSYSNGPVIVVHTKITRSWHLGVLVSDHCCHNIEMAKKWRVFAPKYLIRTINARNHAFNWPYLPTTPIVHAWAKHR